MNRFTALKYSLVMKNRFLYFLVLSVAFGLFAIIFKIPPKISCKIVLLGLFMSLIQVKDLCQQCYKLTFVFFLIVVALKILQYEFYISTGFDLGIFSNILFNISHHGKIFDGLNQAHGFSGHVWPGAFLLAPLMLLWNDPRILLIVQTLAISLIFPAICHLAKQMEIEVRTVSLLLTMIIFNIYLHWVSSFDFHPETLAMPMVIFGIWALNTKKYTLFYILMIISMSFKEDIFLAWASLGFYYLLVGKRKDGFRILTLSTIYGVVVLLLVLKFVDIKMMMNLHYTGNLDLQKRIKPTLEFFTSFGFLPLISLKEISIYLLPFLEHITSSRSLHYKLRCQYSALLIPLMIYSFLKILKEKKVSHKVLTVLTSIAVIFSINEGPIRRYINFSRLNLQKKTYLDKLLVEIPENEKVCLGNHISPHCSTKDGVYQFPTIKDANLIIVDTTWHDFTPLSLDSGLKILREIINSGRFRLVSDSLGIVVLKK